MEESVRLEKWHCDECCHTKAPEFQLGESLEAKWHLFRPAASNFRKDIFSDLKGLKGLQSFGACNFWRFWQNYHRYDRKQNLQYTECGPGSKRGVNLLCLDLKNGACVSFFVVFLFRLPRWSWPATYRCVLLCSSISFRVMFVMSRANAVSL